MTTDFYGNLHINTLTLHSRNLADAFIQSNLLNKYICPKKHIFEGGGGGGVSQIQLVKLYTLY